MTRVMNITALDLSLSETGWARSRAGVRETGTLATKLRGMERLQFFQRRVLELADSADLVVIEGYSFGSMKSQAHALGELGGVVRLSLHLTALPYADVPPASLKQYATGKGNAKKEDMLAAAIRRLEYDGANHNVADALWLLQAALDQHGHGWAKIPEAQRDALAKVEWPTITERIR